MLTNPAPADIHTVEFIAAQRPAAAIFDFDGTLVDTGTLNSDAVRASFTDFALTVPERWLHDAPLADLGTLRERLHADLGLQLPCSDQEFVARTRAHWLAGSLRARPVPRVVSAARHLAAAVPTAVASANDGQVVRAGLAAVGLADLFDVLVAREHVTRLKPAPDAYLLAVAKLAVAPHRCLAFENTTEGITAARAAGIPVIDIREDTWAIRQP
ncbi:MULTISPECIES: HAD family hydrolase [Streptomyces]|uniref:HAD family hydrolase n=1 Tax=Streptomyces TaxID=1883 RepID=UPI000689AE4D|nr:MULTISPECIES: HAD family phosphatase [Streptomyces]